MINKQDFLFLVVDKIVKNIPFSFVRYGDGEMVVLEGENNQSNFFSVLKRQLGYVPDEGERKKIRSNLIMAYVNSNAIGIPTDWHLERKDKWSKTMDVFKKYVGEEILSEKLITSIDVCYEFLYDNNYEDLLKNAKVVNIISCRYLGESLRQKYNIEKINLFLIAPEVKFTSGYVGKNHFPDQFNEIKEWMRTIEVKGNVCLVGAGYVGKIYNNWFRDQGGISLDIGGVMDCFAGKKTRGEGRGLDVEDNTYKL